MLPPPLHPSPCWASLYCRWPKLRSSTLPDPGCPLMHQWKIHPWASTAYATILGLLLSLGKPDYLIWGFGPSGFPVSEVSCPTAGQRYCNGHLLRSSLHSQNLPKVLTIWVEVHRRWSPWSVPPYPRWAK
jgi:hypothetical protein